MPAVEHQLAHLQRAQILQDDDLRPERLEPVVHRTAARQRSEFLRQDRFVGRFEIGIAIEEFDDVIALVHAVLDQRIARQCTDHMDARLRGLETGGQPGKGSAVLARKLDAASFDEGARRLRAGARDDPVAAYGFLPVARFEDEFARADLLRTGFAAYRDSPVGLPLFEQLDVGALGARKIGTAVEDSDDIALRLVGGEAERVLDPRVARTDHGDVLVDIFGGIIELVLDVRQVATRQAEQVGIALRPDRQHHRFGLDRRTVLQGQRERARLSRNAGDIGIGAHCDLAVRHLPVPGVEDHLALAGIEIQIAAQYQIAGRRHDVLALLVFVDGIGKMVGLFEQHMAHAALCRMRSRAQPGGAGAYNRYTNSIAQTAIPPGGLRTRILL